MVWKTGKKVEGRLADDSCVFCGLHFGPAGGHYYKGTTNQFGNIDTEEGGLVIPHLSCCEIQICPGCLKKIRGAGIEC